VWEQGTGNCLSTCGFPFPLLGHSPSVWVIVHSTQPKPGMSLPRELIGEILSHLPSDDKRLFRNRSLVAKSWIDSSRAHIFFSIHGMRQSGAPAHHHVKGPMSLGDVEWVFRPSASEPGWRWNNARSSRRGKEQIRSKTSAVEYARRSDLKVGDNP